MKRSKASWVIGSIAAVVLVMAWSHVAIAQGTDGNSNPAIGTWKMNLAKSKFDPPNLAPKSQTLTTVASGKDGIKQPTNNVTVYDRQ
jgi:hypothetical protein